MRYLEPLLFLAALLVSVYLVGYVQGGLDVAVYIDQQFSGGLDGIHR